VWGTQSEQLQQELPQLEKEICIRIQRLDEKAQIPTKGSKLAAGHDLYSIEDILIPANSRVLVKIGLAVVVPEGTYGRIAPRSGLATKGITVDAGVIDADYRGEVKVLLINHGKLDYEVKIGERIAQLVVERIDNQDWMEVDGLDGSERAGKGFGSTGTGLELKEIQPTICFLQADGNHEFYDFSDINQHPILRKGQVLLSNTIIAKANLKGFEADFLAKVREMAEEDLGWMQRKKELESLKEKGKELPKQWSISDNLLYYKNQLFIPANEDLQTPIANVRHIRKAQLFHQFLYTLGLPYLHPVKLTPPSGPGVGTARQHLTASQLRPNTKGHYHWNLSHNTVYVAAVRPTGCCSQDIWEGTFGELMQVFRAKSVDVE